MAKVLKAAKDNPVAVVFDFPQRHIAEFYLLLAIFLNQ
jgi:hypothetical protein